jgi:ABC-type glycerol-3-phosphate transport system substrate-binding protein
VYTDFMAKNPTITFDIRALAGDKDWDRLARTSISAGDQVDLLNINGQFVRAWVRDNLLYEISTLKDAAPALGRIEASFLDAASPGGKRYYCVPVAALGGAHVAVWYNNKAILDKAGVQPAKTVDDLKAMTAPLKAVGAAPQVHPSGEIWWNPLLVMWIQPMIVDNKPIEFTDSTMKGTVKYDSPEWIKTFTILQDLSKSGELLAGSAAVGMDAAVQLFYTGKAATTYNGSWTLPSLRKPPAGAAFDLQITGLPVLAPAPKAQPLIAFTGYGIAAASKNIDPIVAFLAYATDPDVDAAVVTATQQFSSITSSNAKITDPISKQVAPWFKDGIPPLDWLWEPEVTTEIQNQVQGLIKGDATPQDVGKAVQAKAEQLRREGRSYYK